MEVSAEGSYTHSGGGAREDAETTSVTVQCKVPPLSCVTATVVARQVTCDVPYIAVVQKVKNGVVVERKPTIGTFRGVQCHAFEVTYDAPRRLAPALIP